MYYKRHNPNAYFITYPQIMKVIVKFHIYLQVRYCAEVSTCIGCVMFGIVQQVQEILAQGLSGFLYSLVRALNTKPNCHPFVTK